MPTWVQAGGLEAWIERLKDTQIRKRVAVEMKQRGADWENLFLGAGADKMILSGFKSEALKPLTGKTLAEVAALWGQTPEETAMDLVIRDGSRVGTVYFLMSEDNVRAQVRLPWMSPARQEEMGSPPAVLPQVSQSIPGSIHLKGCKDSRARDFPRPTMAGSRGGRMSRPERSGLL